MTRQLLVDIKSEINWSWLDDTPGLQYVDNNLLRQNFSYDNGTGVNQADRVWHVADALAGGAHADYDLTALDVDVFTSQLTITMAAVKAILLVNQSETNSLRLGGAASNPWQGPFGAPTHTLEVPPGAPLLLVNRVSGWAVSGSGKVLRLLNEGLTATAYSLVIVGRDVATSSSSSSSSGM